MPTEQKQHCFSYNSGL